MLLQSVDTIYKECDGDLKKFSNLTPKIGSSECFCYEPFFLSFQVEKIEFLMTRVKELSTDWLSIDH
jgi:hypothetical protein